MAADLSPILVKWSSKSGRLQISLAAVSSAWPVCHRRAQRRGRRDLVGFRRHEGSVARLLGY